jgi:hypothetical protein
MRHEKALSSAFAGNAVGGTVPPISVAGKWVNQYGSSAQFVISGTSLSGKYISKVSSSNTTVEGPIIGYIAGDVVAFSVLWPAKLGSITSWVGQIVDVDGTETLKTLWQLVMNVPEVEEPEKLWTSIFAGADEFTRVV